MARSDRIQVTVSLPMRVALTMLARRNGIALGTQATIMLRQALDRTITSVAGQAEVRRARTYQSVAGWREDRATEREVELEYQRQESRARMEEVAVQAEAAGHGTLDHIALAQEGEGR